MTIQVFSETLVLEHCYKCGVPFGMEQEYQQIRLERGGDFYCPNGHSQCYCEIEVERLKREVDRAEKEAKRQRRGKQHAQRSLAATKGHVTRLRRKMAAGRCPCCKAEFPDLAEHMKWKHPDFAEQEA